MRILSLLRLRATFLGLFLFSSVSLCLCGSTHAALDAEVKKPYQVTVVLHVAEHRLLTDVFRDRIEREVRDGLQAALGDLAVVKVVREHPKLAEVLEKGLRSLDGWNDRTPLKTHFVLIDFSGVHYELQARQYDGQTGFATPVVRREKTQDREFVARTAVLMIERDFGISATFQTWPVGPRPQKVQLELKGGGLDAPLNRWVQKGDVFAVVAIPTGNGSGRVVPDAIVQIETPPAEGAAACDGKLFWRRKPPTGAGNAGYRCVKLGAIKGPVNVRLVNLKPDGSPGELLEAPTLLVRREGFSGELETLLSVLSRDKAHTYDTSKFKNGQFDRVAFVSVLQGDAVRAEIPLVILDDQQVVVAVALNDKDAEPLDVKRREWKKSVAQSYAVQASIFTELQELSAKKDTPRADLIAKAKEGAKHSSEDLLRLRDERKELFGDPKTLTDADRRDLVQAEQRMNDIQKGEEELQQYAERQAKIDKEENSPERKQAQEEIERGKLLERDGELGKAITVYETILAMDGFKSEDLEARVKRLRELWKPKNETHRTARAYIYHVFPTLDTAALQTQLKDASDALAECIKVGDTIGPQKLYKGIQIHSARLLEEAKGLKNTNEDDVKQLKVLAEIGASLNKLEAEIKAYLDKAPK